MDRSPQSLARELVDFVVNRPGAWRQIVESRTVPAEFLPDHRKAFDAETVRESAAKLMPIAAILDAARAAVPPRPLNRPADANESGRVSGIMREMHDYTAGGIAKRLQQAAAEQDYALLERAVPWVTERQMYAKPLMDSGALTSAIVDAQVALDSHPQNVAREQAQQHVAALEVEVATLAQCITAGDPAASMQVYESCGAFPVLLPPPAAL